MSANPIPERDLHADLVEQIALAQEALKAIDRAIPDIFSVEHDGAFEAYANASIHLGQLLDSMYDDLAHSAGRPCRYEPHHEYCSFERSPRAVLWEESHPNVLPHHAPLAATAN